MEPTCHCGHPLHAHRWAGIADPGRCTNCVCSDYRTLAVEVNADISDTVVSIATCARCEHPVDSHAIGIGCTEIGCDSCFLVPTKTGGGLEEMSPPEHDVDMVNHPPHYTRFGVEVIDITEHLTFCSGNAVKYICRAGFKDPEKELEDLEKAHWYLTREINRIKKEK